MSSGIKFHFFAHSWVSDWNHGNAHFLRGLARSLERRVTRFVVTSSWVDGRSVTLFGAKANERWMPLISFAANFLNSTFSFTATMTRARNSRRSICAKLMWW